MAQRKGYKIIPLSFNRKAVIASASVTREKNAIHCITEVDISIPRSLIRQHFEATGEKLSFTAYIVTCLANALKNYPEFNSFIKGRRLVILDDLTISVLIERDILGEKVPEPIGIRNPQAKSFLEIDAEIKNAKNQQDEKLGSLSGKFWFRLIPGFLLKLFIRIADKNILMGKKYGKVAVTAVGMFSKEPVWFIPHGSATVLLTVGSISQKAVQTDNQVEFREHLCLTASFDHDIIDGAPASRFINDLSEIIKSGNLIPNVSNNNSDTPTRLE